MTALTSRFVQWLNRLTGNRPVENKPANPVNRSLRHWADLYLADIAYEHTYKTSQTYTSWMRRFFRWLEDEMGLAEPTLDDFTSDVLDEYVRYQRSRAPEHKSVVHDPKKPPSVVNKNTVRSAMHPIKGLAAYLVFKKQLSENPVASVSIPSKDTKGKRPIGTDDEVYLLIKEAEKNPDAKARALDLAILYMVANSAARVQEVANMPFSTLDLQESKIRVVAKGGHEQTYYFSPATGDAVREWLKFRPQNTEHDRLFCHGTRRPISDDYVRKIIYKYAADAGIENPRGVLPHAQKHLVGCRLMREGVDLVTISQRLAHSKPTTTLQHYLHANDASIKASRSIGLETVVEAKEAEPQPPAELTDKRQHSDQKPEGTKLFPQQIAARFVTLPAENTKRRNMRK